MTELVFAILWTEKKSRTWSIKPVNKYFNDHSQTLKTIETISKVQLSLRAILWTSRRKKSFLLFFAHEKGLGHMFQK